MGEDKVQQWEYKLVTLVSRKRWFGLQKYITEQDVLDFIDGIGSLGWELVSERVDSGDLKYIFKRPKQ